MQPFRKVRPFAQGGVSELTLIELPDMRNAILRELMQSKVFNLREHLGFRRGTKIHAEIGQHSNVLQAYEHGYDFLRPYEIIEYIAGDNLKVLFNSRDDNVKMQPAEILTACARGLAWVHHCGFMHLDVKPENFLCCFRGKSVVKLCDFDLARPADDTGRRPQMGTLAYMAPEQIRRKVASRASDVFAFATMAYQLFTGRMPFTGDNKKSTIRHQSSENVIAQNVSEINPAVPHKWDVAIAWGLAKKPEERLPDMEAWMNEIN